MKKSLKERLTKMIGSSDRETQLLALAIILPKWGICGLKKLVKVRIVKNNFVYSISSIIAFHKDYVIMDAGEYWRITPYWPSLKGDAASFNIEIPEI